MTGHRRRGRQAVIRIAAAAIGVAVLLLPALFGAAEAWARAGGGHTFSGGGHFGGFHGGYHGGYHSHGSGGDGGLALYLLIELLLTHPVVGLPVLLIVGIAYLYINKHRGEVLQDWDSVGAAVPPPPPDLEGLRALDPEFSVVLFEDFTYRLFAQAHQARSDAAQLAALAPYISDPSRQALAAQPPTGVPITNVVIGAMRVLSVNVPAQPTAPNGDPQYASVSLEFEANYTAGPQGKLHTYYAVERWSLVRAATAKTRPPDPTRKFPCPNCGAPFSSSDSQRCDYCGEVVSTGRFDWLVNGITCVRQDERPPALTGTVPEQGTELPTVMHPEMDARWAALQAEDPAVTQEALAQRLQLIYGELNAAWTALDLARVRPYVSDGLFDYLQYWITAYRNQGLRNVLENMSLFQWMQAKVVRDRHYDAITVRIWGTGLDYTIDDASQKVVGGSRRKERTYTEYWTLIRAAGTRGPTHADKNCPNCGAEIKISMGGNCEYCGAHITSGEFDWVLGKIEQDDSYTG